MMSEEPGIDQSRETNTFCRHFYPSDFKFSEKHKEQPFEEMYYDTPHFDFLSLPRPTWIIARRGCLGMET